MSEDLLMTEWKGSSSKIDGDREAGDGTDVVLGLQQTSSPVILKPPLPSTVQQPYQNRNKNIGGQDLQGVSPNGDVAFHSTNETSKLLDISSSSSSESDLNLQIIPPKRKVRFKRKLRPLQKAGKSKNGIPCRDESASASQGCCCCTGGEGLSGLAFVLVFCALGTLMWFHYGLSTRLDALQKQHNNLEAQSKETPEALHNYHIQLKGLEQNITTFSQDMKKINTEILSLQDAVKQLKDVSSGLKESIAAAPEIKTLPRDVQSLTENVAAFGSKISVLESTVGDLKKGQRQLVDSEQELKTEHQQIKNSLVGLSVTKEAATQEDTQALRNSILDVVHQELMHIVTSVDELNVTLGARLREVDHHFLEANESLSWLSNDLAQLHVYVYQNLSSNLGGRSIDLASLGPALQQESQHILREVLGNGSAVQSSEVPATGQDWKEVLAHAQQLSLAYWALLKDLSLTPVDTQNSTVVFEAALVKAVSQLTANHMAALQALNSSLVSLTSRTEKLEASLGGSQLQAVPGPTTVTAAEVTSPSGDALPKQQSPPVPLERSPVQALEGQQPSPLRAAIVPPFQEGKAAPMPTATPTPTVPRMLRHLRPTIPANLEEKVSSSSSNSDRRSENISSDLESIL